MANNVDFTGSSDAKSKVDNTLYTADVAVKGYKTDSLEISGKIKTSGMGNGEQMIWSNAYARDYNCSSGSCAEKGSSYSSYLLKSDTDNPGGCSEASYKSSHKSECCVDAPTSDSVCYMDCNCRMEAHSNGSPSKVREEYSLCQFINGNCAWGYERTYTKESGCASQMLSQYPNGGSGTCQWVTNIYITADAPYCQHMYNSCIMSGGGTTRPYYYIYNQSYIVEEVCDRCKNGW